MTQALGAGPRNHFFKTNFSSNLLEAGSPEQAPHDYDYDYVDDDDAGGGGGDDDDK